MKREQLEQILLDVQKPAQYIGGELNSIMKDKEKVDCRLAFCFPDKYEVGMSHLGMKILYSLYNERENWWCERVFAPDADMEQLMREKNIPLYGLESLDPIRDFDFILFTMQYEMSYTAILNMLDLAGVPVRSKDRTALAPMVVAGGPCACNPEPVADFIDIFIIGEGEEVNIELTDLYMQAKKEGWDKQRFLQQAAQIGGVYVPSLYDVSYREDGTIDSVKPNCPQAPEKVTKRIIADLDKVYYPKQFVVPFINIVHDRSMLEIQRGCIRGCRFCQAGMVYRPTRPRDINMLKETARAMLKNTGHEEITLSSLSSSDYNELEEIVTFLIDEFHTQGVNISLPSLRIDAFSLDVMSKVQDVRKSSLTFAPEAGTQRMRNVINKGLTEDDILNGAGQAFEGGWTKVKLYFMLGLPTETQEDMEGIAVLADKVARRYYEIPKDQRNGKCQITASSSFFVPKPFSPLQWATMQPMEEYIRRAGIVQEAFRNQLNRKSLRYNWHTAEVTVLEGVFARGDRKVGKVLEEAYRLGCIYDAWDEYFDYDKWLQAFENTGVDMDFYNLRKRELDEIFPWDFINCGVTKSFLIREWKNAMEGNVTPNCRAKCSGCGAASYGGGVCFEGKN